ncbi:MAG: hypothetical protein AAGK97_01705 [Bacteroidota bacterium]
MKSIIEAYKNGWAFLFSKKKIGLLIYGLNFAFAALIAMPLHNYLHSTIETSLSSNNEFIKFSYTYINDFLQAHGSGLGVVYNTSIFILLIFFFIMVFVSGGIISIVLNKSSYQNFANFFQGGAKYFWRFLRLDIYFIAIYILLLFIAFKIFEAGGLSVFDMENETGIINRFYVVSICTTVILFIFGIVHMYAKLFIAQSDKILIHQSIGEAFRFTFKNFFRVFLLAVLNLLVFAAIAGLYFWYRKHFHFSNSSILLLFIMGQLFILFRIACRVVRYASYGEMVEKQNIAV